MDSKIKKNKLFQKRKYFCKWLIYKSQKSNLPNDYFKSFLVLVKKFFNRINRKRQKEFFTKIMHRTILERKQTKPFFNDKQLFLTKYLLLKEKYEIVLKLFSIDKIKKFVKYKREKQLFCIKVLEILNKERIRRSFDSMKMIKKLANSINYFQNIMRYLLVKKKAFSFYKMFSIQKCFNLRRRDYRILDVLNMIYLRKMLSAFQNILEISRAKHVIKNYKK